MGFVNKNKLTNISKFTTTFIKLATAMASLAVGIGYIVLKNPNYGDVLYISPYILKSLSLDITAVFVTLFSIYYISGIKTIKVFSEPYQYLDASIKLLSVILILVVSFQVFIQRFSFWNNKIVENYVENTLEESIYVSKREGLRRSLNLIERRSNVLKDHPSTRRLSAARAALKKRVAISNDFLSRAGINSLDNWNPISSPINYFRVVESARLNPNDNVSLEWIQNAHDRLISSLIPSDIDNVCYRNSGSRTYTVKQENMVYFRILSSDECEQLLYRRWNTEEIEDKLLEQDL